MASSARNNESDYYAVGEVLSSSSASSSEDSSVQLLDEGSLLFSEMNRFVHDDNGTVYLFISQRDVKCFSHATLGVVMMTREREIRKTQLGVESPAVLEANPWTHSTVGSVCCSAKMLCTCFHF